MVYLWQRDYSQSTWAGLSEISKAIESPTSFTAKVLQQLTKQGLVLSVRGPHGGFAKNKDQMVTLADIVRAIDGDGILRNCVLGFKACSSENPCPVHHKFIGVREYLQGVLMTTDMQELTILINNGKAVLKLN